LNLTVIHWLNISAPKLTDGEFDKCSIFNITYNQDTTRPPEETPKIKCEAWDYDTSLFKVGLYIPECFYNL